MMKRIVCCLIACLLMVISSPVTFAQDDAPAKKQVAVYVTDNDDVEEIYKKIVQSKMISALTNSSRYRVLERNAEFLKKIQSDRDYAMSGNVKDSQIAAIGKEFGAQFVMVIDLSESFSEIFVSVRMVNVALGEITSTAEELISDATSQKMMKAAEKIAQAIIGSGAGLTSSVGGGQSSSNGNVETFTVNGVTFEMVRVNESYSIGKTEVTQRLWQAVMGNNPSNFKGENRPVESVTWFECQDFCDRLSRLTGRIFRLPTEAEWEYAARGGSKSHGYEYSGGNDLYRVGWYWDNSDKMTHAVGQKVPNELGIYDMSGNVWEWCSDYYNGDSSFRVDRGGGWHNDASYCRVAYRGYITPGDRHYGLGLRLAL